jgi:hypothetical protein
MELEAFRREVAEGFDAKSVARFLAKHGALQPGGGGCSGQLTPDTGLSFSSATAGARPPLN